MTRSGPAVRALVALAVALLAGRAPATAQEGTFRGSVEVHVVNLPVVVLDADGYPVHGLTVADFRVREDGEPREVTNFSEVVAAPRVGGPSVGTTHDVSRTVLAFDNRSLDRRGRRTAVEALRGLVEASAGPAHQVMVVTLDGRPEVVLPFSDDAATIGEALDRVLETPCDGAILVSRRRALQQEIYDAEVMRVMPNGEIDWDYGVVRGQTLKQQLFLQRDQEVARVRHALATLEVLLRPLGGFSGRKSVVWVGSDLSSRPSLALYDAFHRKFSLFADRLNLEPPPVWALRTELIRHLDAVAAAGQSVDATIHAIDPRDHDQSAAVADFASPSAATWDAVLEEPAQWTPGSDLAELRPLWEGAQQLAGSSGGSFIANTRSFAPFIDRLQAQMGSYYWLGYARPSQADGRMHQVEVDVACKGCLVRHSERVLDRTHEQRLADLARAELQVGGTRNPLGLRAELELTPDPKQPSRLLLAIPTDRLVQVPDGHDGVARILVVVMAADDGGGLSRPRAAALAVRLRQGVSDPTVLAVAQVDVLLEADTRAVAVAVRDRVAGVESAAVAPVPR